MNRIKLTIIRNKNEYKFYYTNGFNIMTYFDKYGNVDRLWDKSKIFRERIESRFGLIG